MADDMTGVIAATGLRIGAAVGLNLADVARNEKELPLMRAVETKASIRAE